MFQGGSKIANTEETLCLLLIGKQDIDVLTQQVEKFRTIAADAKWVRQSESDFPAAAFRRPNGLSDRAF